MAATATTRRDDKPDTQEEEDFGVQRTCTSAAVSSDAADQRLDRHKAAQFLRDAERNRKQIEKLEREGTLSVQCRRNGWADLSAQLEEYEQVLEQERRADKMKLQKQLEKINNNVRKFQRQLIDMKPTPQSIEKLKEIMSEVEISINTLKEEQRLCHEEFLKEERACRQEITAYEKKIETWSLAIKPNPKVPTAPSIKTRLLDKHLPAEVRALEAFLLKTGGLYGGWDKIDHQIFLDVWTKHSGQPAYRKDDQLYLLDKTAEEIEQHEDWQQQLIHLQGRKREAIQRWKASKNQERQNRMQSQQEREEAKSQKHQHRTEEEKRELAQQLNAWKEEKRMRKEQEEELRLVEEIQKRKQEKEKRRRQLEVKLTLEEQLRVRREEEEEREQRRREEKQREMVERRQEAAKSIKHFRERDLHKVEAKLHENHLREKEEEERQRRIAAKLKDKVDGQVSRDPSRLTRPTKGWQERMKRVGPSGGGPVLQTFHRAVPTWRQGL